MYIKYKLKTKKNKQRKIKTKKNKNKERKIKTKKNKRKQKMLGGTITISDANDFGLNLFNTINGKIYQIKINDCYFYFRVNDSVKYLLLELGTEYHILKLNESIPDLTREEFNEIESKINSTDLNRMQKNMFLTTKNIKIYQPTDCEKSYELEAAKSAIQELNLLLKEKCTNLTLQLDYVYNMDVPVLTRNLNSPKSLLLCLNNNEGCISSILISISKSDIIISSDTLLRYEGKKYNKLLRCVIIIISKLLSDSFQNVISIAINPISAYLFMKLGGIIPHDDESNEPFFTFLNERGIELNSETNYRELFDTYKKNMINPEDFGLIVYIPLTPENIENAGIIFNQILNNEIIC
jgi:hypothetical protein